MKQASSEQIFSLVFDFNEGLKELPEDVRRRYQVIFEQEIYAAECRAILLLAEEFQLPPTHLALIEQLQQVTTTMKHNTD